MTLQGAFIAIASYSIKNDTTANQTAAYGVATFASNRPLFQKISMIPLDFLGSCSI
jgi:hypothetical protein